MPSWIWIAIAVAVLVVLAVVVWRTLARRRTDRLQSQFGPEYDRTVESADSRRSAESELAARQERHQELELRELTSAARDRYLSSWRIVQGQFVDDPRGAVASADSLIQSVMADRGYPVDDFDQRAADISVDHPEVVENYREGHRLARASADAAGKGSTEDLRQAMRHYRTLFDELLEPGSHDADEPSGLDRADAPRERPEQPVR